MKRDAHANPWWRLEGKAAAEQVFAEAKRIARDLEPRRQEMLHHLRMYAGRYDLRGGSYAAGRVPSYNITRSIVDTAQSLIAQNRPRPMYLTTEGSWELQQRAKDRARVIDAQFDTSGVDSLRFQLFRDGAVMGIGLLGGCIDPDSRTLKVERVDPLRFLVDLCEGLGGEQPRSTYYVRAVDRGVLCALYPEQEELIKKASSPRQAGLSRSMWLHGEEDGDLVAVVDAVHLPSREGADDGARMLAVSSGALEQEDYDACEQPYAWFRYQEDPASFYGFSLAEQCRAASRRLNRLGETIEKSSRLMSTVKVIVPRSSNMGERDFGNGIGELWEYDEGRTGNPPQVVPMSGVHPAWFEERANIREEVFSATGLSTLVAEGKKPSGLDSGAAQIAYDDIQSRRHVVQTLMWSEAFMMVAKLFERLNDQNTAEGHDVPLPTRRRLGRREWVKDIKWSECSKDAGALYTRMSPISALPTTPRGKWGMVKEWIASGFMSRTQAQQVLDFPDLDEALRFEMVDYDSVMDDLERIIDGEVDLVPEPVVSPQVAADISRATYLQLRADRAPREILDAVHEYMLHARELLQMAQAPAQPAPGAAPMGAPAPGVPGPMPSPGAPPMGPGGPIPMPQGAAA